MIRIALALVLAAAVIPSGLGATPRKVVFSGTISALKPTAVTVRDGRSVSCQIRRVSPAALGYVLGSEAQITCIRGVLSRIAGIGKPLPMIKTGVVPSPVRPSIGSVGPTPTATGTVTALTPSGISIGDVTCTINQGVYGLLVTDGIGVGSNGAMSCAGSGGSMSFTFAFGGRSISVTTGTLTLGTVTPSGS